MASRWHPSDVELAMDPEGPNAVVFSEHLSTCRRCRNTTSDYRWLRGELVDLLRGVAGRVGVPPPAWEVVRRRNVRVRRERLASSYSAATIGIAALLCLAFVTPRAATAACTAPGTIPLDCLRYHPEPALLPPAAPVLCDRRQVTPTPIPSGIQHLSEQTRPTPIPVPTAPRLAAE